VKEIWGSDETLSLWNVQRRSDKEDEEDEEDEEIEDF
jgi:hypothetical protein